MEHCFSQCRWCNLGGHVQKYQTGLLLMTTLLFYLINQWLTRHSRLSKNFIVNLCVTWTEIIVSGPKIIVTVGTGVRVATKVIIIGGASIVSEVDVMSRTKGWTIVIVTIRGIAWIGYVVFKVSIPIIVPQWVYKGVWRVQVSSIICNKINGAKTVLFLEISGYRIL